MVRKTDPIDLLPDSNQTQQNVRKIWAHIPEKEEHLERMKNLSMAMADKIQLDEMQARELENLAVMHDIGKVAIPLEILNKPDLLDNAEWETMKKHCKVGYHMTQALTDYQLADYILAHHERWDGKGYPNGLKGENIPMPARIISIIDAFDIMTHNTPYSEAMSVIQALTELERCSGSQFDAELVKVFIGIVMP